MVEKTYVIPLRHEWLKVPIFLRTRKSVKAIKNYVKKHSKVEDVKIGKYLNNKLWERGNRYPPHKVQVNVEIITEKKEGKEKKHAVVDLVGAPKEVKKEVKKKKLLDKLKDRVSGKEEVKQEEIKEEQKALEKAEEKQMETAKAPKFFPKDSDKKKSMKSMKEHNMNIDKTPPKERAEKPKMEK
ncbi:MAG: 60S ribosomal protein L31 [Nanoarchaeota archaeon]|nr:60S ribosomal protein L31 [Nanoarchaeota archaeon]